MYLSVKYSKNKTYGAVSPYFKVSNTDFQNYFLRRYLITTGTTDLKQLNFLQMPI